MRQLVELPRVRNHRFSIYVVYTGFVALRSLLQRLEGPPQTLLRFQRIPLCLTSNEKHEKTKNEQRESGKLTLSH